MDLVIDEVMELQEIFVTHRHLTVEFLAGAAVEQIDLARLFEPRLLQHLDDVRLADAVKHRR